MGVTGALCCHILVYFQPHQVTETQPRNTLHLHDNTILSSWPVIKQKHSSCKSQKVEFSNWAINLNHREVCLSGRQHKLTNCSVEPEGASQGNAACVTNDTHPPSSCTPGPLLAEEKHGKIRNIPEFRMTLTWIPGWEKNNVSAQKTEKTQRYFVPDGGEIKGSFSPTEEDPHSYYCWSRDNAKREESKSKPKQQQWEDPSVGVSYLFSMVTNASTLVANLPSLATKTLKSCQQTTTAHGFRAFQVFSISVLFQEMKTAVLVQLDPQSPREAAVHKNSHQVSSH